jgi:aspartate/methionine/tyrosine aminotransferase
MALPDSFYDRLAREYRIRRDLLLEGLRALGFGAFKPRGAYYLVGRIPESGFTTDRDDSVHLLKDAGVATVPVSSFYLDEPHTGLVRFCFAKKEETIRMALGRLASYVERSTSSRGLSSRLRSSST